MLPAIVDCLPRATGCHLREDPDVPRSSQILGPRVSIEPMSVGRASESTRCFDFAITLALGLGSKQATTDARHDANRGQSKGRKLTMRRCPRSNSALDESAAIVCQTADLWRRASPVALKTDLLMYWA